MISSRDFIPLWRRHHHRQFTEDSRFAEFNLVALSGEFKAHLKPQFLSPGITYTVNLVFKLTNRNGNSNEPTYVALDYKLKWETKCSTAYLAHEREDRWMTVELYQFTSHKRDFNLEILFDGIQIHLNALVVEGIEFRPLERVASEVEKVDIQPVSDWERRLPEDHEEIIKWSKDSIKWRTKKELYFLFCKGFLINNGEEWFFLAKNGKKCLFLPARALLDTNRWTFQSLPNLRFEEVALDCFRSYFHILGEIKFQMLSPGTIYACNLVYKITGDVDKIEEPIEVRNWYLPFSDSDEINYRYIYLLGPQLPVIRPNVDENTHNPPISQMPKFKGLPRLRNNGWMEVEIWEFETSVRVDKFEINFLLQRKSGSGFQGISVQGIEVKPKR
ncbi:F-box protein PP2-B15-like [Cynara cardunculus var. scolymus]|uniref:F-box protein PP2-B15-like n=1 Tax=Cynara cardunculus var. scolymus TaxID=59895 RepID=UPI000D62C4F2|nr:F-box protein PP2-B15-like [Cynara cardunculus var. scolymus]